MQEEITNQKNGSVVMGEMDDSALGGLAEAKEKLGEIVRDLRFSDDEDSQSTSFMDRDKPQGEDRLGRMQQSEAERQVLAKQRRAMREEEKRA